MKKPTFSQALAAETAPVIEDTPLPPAKVKKSDGRVTTTIRIPETWLDELKQVALNEKTKLNDLLLSGAKHELEVRGRLPKK
ncbi:hypothetical protein EBE87_27715 [Pseudoroseomonas wenyumeiae]|uniref:Toxin-antitoxin system HicB family antitoxin n=1 Tax=Teichococcus wenyumeiae TaxID=2478470 RepID=A0A3A9JRK3_9PROT|nr:hypothetical protein [Pseudoroseomonas wenyumeiae]RKK03308.1 hypothetical protein D6Z83_15220 [Pseudoroseomonas wenyumeiae]RMI14578.1 hypothetical protein EBE87_27715 [Pseudoroseomonas wenyumeiae]